IFSLVFRHEPELAAHPQIQIGCDPAQFISALVSRRIEPVGPDPGVREIVDYRHGGFSVCAEAGESASRRNIVSPALDAPGERQPFRNREVRVEGDGLKFVFDGFVRPKRSVRFYYGNIYIAVVKIKGDGPAIEIENPIHE